ncbi:MAG: hypothetical protein HYS63_03975 [Methylocystis sp.]|nr:hypothetical protein [Methylocystis sp.]
MRFRAAARESESPILSHFETDFAAEQIVCFLSFSLEWRDIAAVDTVDAGRFIALTFVERRKPMAATRRTADRRRMMHMSNEGLHNGNRR